MTKYILPVLSALAVPWMIFAQELNSVSFEQSGDYRLGRDIFELNVQSRKGLLYDERVVNDDIKRLHATGFFSDVVSETSKRPDGKIDLVFKIVPMSVVKSITFKGNEKYDNNKLMEFVSLSVGAPLNNKNLAKAVTDIRNYYVKNGHNDATVFPRLVKVSGGVNVVFEIKENLKLKVHSVKFIGTKAISDRTLRDSMENRYSMFHWVPLLDLGLLNKTELQNDLVRLRDLYWDKGYLDFRVKDVKLNSLKDSPEFIDIVMTVEEGEPYKIGKIEMKGASRFPESEILERIRMKPGDVFRSSLERSSIDSIEKKYSPLGYADFFARSERLPDFRTHTVNLLFDIHEGLPYKVRDVFISGNKWTKDYVIRRELAIMPGDPVDKDRISASRSRLMGMGYFQNVEAVSVNSPEPGTKDVDIHVKEKNFLNAKIGAGWSDTDSLAGMIELSHSNMDILDPKNYFTGGGQRARIIAMYGIERYNFEADFTEPWLFGIPLRWDLGGYIRNVIYDKWEEQRIGVTTSLTKRVFDDFTSISGGYTFEHVDVHNMDKWMSPVFRKERGGSYVGRVQVVLDRDTRDNALDPTSGYDINALGAVSSRIFGGSYDYYRFELKGIQYVSFFDKMIRASIGGKIGTIGNIGGGNGKDPPIYERYFLGGGDSIRGFPYRSIGPTDCMKDNYGGDFMYLVTAEVSHPIYKFIRGAVFCDVGNSTHSRFGPFSDPNIGLGYGLRIRIPQINAPIKLDLAYPILNNERGVKSKLRFHFNMGFAIF